MISSIRSFVHRGVLGVAGVAALSGSLLADGIQPATFNVSGTSQISLVGNTTGVLNENSPNVLLLDGVPLSAQGLGAFDVTYTGTIQADISFDLTTRAVKGIRITGANLVAGNSGNWKPGGTFSGGWPNGGNDETPANYGGNVAGLINFATRDMSMTMTSGTTVYSVAPNGNFTVNNTNIAQFSGGNNSLYSSFDGGGLVDSNDLLTSYRNYEIDFNAVQPMLDSAGNPNPKGGQPYPSGLVWRYVEAGTGPNGERLYGDLAPAFDITKGGVPNGYDDEQWYLPHDGTVGKPDVARIYDGAGAHTQLQIQNLGNNYSDAAGTVPVSSNVAATYTGAGDANNNYNLDLKLNADLFAPFFVGDFAVTLNLTQSENLFGDLVPGTGQFIASENLNLLPGDINFDGTVDIFDVNVVSDNWSDTGTAGLFLTGDANGDGVVDIFDVNVISDNWGRIASGGTGGGASVGGAAAVPEPATWALAGLCAIAALALRRRR